MPGALNTRPGTMASPFVLPRSHRFPYTREYVRQPPYIIHVLTKKGYTPALQDGELLGLMCFEDFPSHMQLPTPFLYALIEEICPELPQPVDTSDKAAIVDLIVQLISHFRMVRSRRISITSGFARA